MKNREIIDIYEGFDDAGFVFKHNDYLYRGIYKKYKKTYDEVYSQYLKNKLFQYGIIDTKKIKPSLFPELDIAVLYQHTYIPFISYPHEWSTEMMKDAALFHIDLFSKLCKFDLTLKDWHPWNILFEYSKPIFIDFTSIIPQDDLPKQKYLNHKLSNISSIVWDRSSIFIYQMYLLMFQPYFLFPLYLYSKKKYSYARKRILETTLNTSNTTIKKKEIFPDISMEKSLYSILKIIKILTLFEKHQCKKSFYSILRSEISRLKVSQTSSDYTNYYNQKKENYSFTNESRWTTKQITIKHIIKKYKPKTILDIGANTGWYSILAAKLGCKVVAVDVDETCINNLYGRAKKENLNILPLVVDILNIPEPVFPQKNHNLRNSNLNKQPLLKKANQRLNCDMVFVLALIHHLSLGMGKSFEEIIYIIRPFVKKYLILEFVSIEDKLIQNEPSFFPAYNNSKDKFNDYSLVFLLRILKKYYSKIEVIPSNPNSRSIVICEI